MALGSVNNLLAAFRGVLLADTSATGIFTLTGGRIYSQEGPQDAVLPLVVYQVVTDTINSTLSTDAAEMEIQVDVYGGRAAGLAAVQALADRAVAVLNRVALTATGWNAARVHCSSVGLPDVSDEAYRVMLRCQLYAN